MWLPILLLFSSVLTGVFSRPASRHDSGVPLIMGGTEAADGQFPWTLSIEYDGSLGWLHMCGGILVAPNYALTGAKCVNYLNMANLRAWAGLLYRNDTAATNAQLLTIDLITIHPEYNEYQPGVPNDIAILRFVEAANTSKENIAEATLPPESGSNYDKSTCFINGWGRYNDENVFSNQMLYAQIPVIPNPECNSQLETIGQADILDTHICVMSDPPGQGACNGDSGGPLNCYQSESEPELGLVVVGAGSWTVTTEGNCNAFYPSVYTRLSKYLKWISDNTPPV
jgi:secreted trypsin-like serine protease